MKTIKYQSGHCGIGRHGNCTGSYAGTACTCPCGHVPPAPLPLWWIPASDIGVKK